MELQGVDIDQVSRDLDLMSQATDTFVEGALTNFGPTFFVLSVAVGGIMILSKLRNRGEENGS